MADPERLAESAFATELLLATRAGRVAWTGTSTPECYQAALGAYILIIRLNADKAPLFGLHHRTGHPIDTLTGEADPQLEATMRDVYHLARNQALGMRKIWRGLSKHLAGAEGQGPAQAD